MTALSHRGEISVSGLTTDEAVRLSIEQARDPHGESLLIKQVAALANIPLTRMHEIASGVRKAWACEVSPIVHASGHTLIADVIERDIWRVGVALPEVPPSDGTVLAETAESCAKFGELMKTIAEKSAGGFTRAEAREIRAKALAHISKVLATVHEVESIATDSGSLLSPRRSA